MKLHWSPKSPFVRKVLIVLHETGQFDHIEIVRSVAAIAEPNALLMRDNPLSQIPTLVLGNGMPLYDSPVICEYLDSLHDGSKLFPVCGDERWQALRRQALADGMLGILLIWRQERNKSRAQQLPSWVASFQIKLEATLAVLEADAAALSADRFGIGHISIGCMLSYLDFRFPDLDWRRDHCHLAIWHDAFRKRPSVVATEIVDDS